MSDKYSGTFLRVRNLEQYQHYTNRNPPWIKLHQSILEDYDFAGLPDAAKWHALAITLLASRTENHFPNDPAWIARRIEARSKINLDALLNVSFLEVCDSCKQCASNLLAERKQVARESRGEREGEQSRVEGSPSLKKQAQEIFADHVEVRGRWFSQRNGRQPRAPTMSPQLERAIVAAIQGHDYDSARAAGRGCFLSSFHTGKNPEGELILDPPIVWRMNKTVDNVDRFSRLYFDHMADKGLPLPWKAGE